MDLHYQKFIHFPWWLHVCLILYYLCGLTLMSVHLKEKTLPVFADWFQQVKTFSWLRCCPQDHIQVKLELCPVGAGQAHSQVCGQQAWLGAQIDITCIRSLHRQEPCHRTSSRTTVRSEVSQPVGPGACSGITAKGLSGMELESVELGHVTALVGSDVNRSRYWGSGWPQLIMGPLAGRAGSRTVDKQRRRQVHRGMGLPLSHRWDHRQQASQWCTSLSSESGAPQSWVPLRFHNILPGSQECHRVTFVHKQLPNICFCGRMWAKNFPFYHFADVTSTTLLITYSFMLGATVALMLGSVSPLTFSFLSTLCWIFWVFCISI